MEDMARRPYDANDIADWFINTTDRQAGETITTLEVQRLVFFSQAWHLANTGRPLFADDFEAWATGPIAPKLYERFQYYDYETIPALDRTRIVDGEKLQLLEGVRKNYAGLSGDELDLVSRETGGPWAQARGNIDSIAACDTVISKEAIAKFYAQKIGKA